MHRPEVVRIEGDSYRAKEAEEREARRQAERAVKATARDRTSQHDERRLHVTSTGTIIAIGTCTAGARCGALDARAGTCRIRCLQSIRESLRAAYGLEAWRDQLVPDVPMPDFDPDEPF